MELSSFLKIRWWLLILLTRLLTPHNSYSPSLPLVLSSPTDRYHGNQGDGDQGYVIMTCDNVTVANGAVYQPRDGKMRDRIIVDCYEGYQLEGNSQVECGSGSTDISALLPSCNKLVECEIECDITHGSCVGYTNGDRINPGDEVTYKCDETYIFSSIHTRLECTENNGTFNHPFPTCVQKWQGYPCTLTESEAISNFLNPTAARSIQRGQSIEVECQHGYFPREHNGPVSLVCNDQGTFDRELSDLCTFVGVDFHLDYSAERIIKHTGGEINVDQGLEVKLKCIAHSLTTDGLPLPDISWQAPSKLTHQTTDSDGISSISYIEGVSTEYKVTYRFDVITGDYVYQAEAILRIASTMEVHSGAYSCVVKLVDFTQAKSKTVQVKGDFTPAMWLLLILPVVMFVSVHCFYRKAIRNGRHPFHSSNKMAKDIMQEVDKRKKLEELNLQYYSSGGKSIKPISTAQTDTGQPRGRRGAVIDV